MSATKVDAEHLYAALSAYLLAGIFFALFYWVLEQIGPGAFAAAGNFSRVSAIYFSFVTLATLGYGDIIPRSDVARGLAIVERGWGTALSRRVGGASSELVRARKRCRLTKSANSLRGV